MKAGCGRVADGFRGCPPWTPSTSRPTESKTVILKAAIPNAEDDRPLRHSRNRPAVPAGAHHFHVRPGAAAHHGTARAADRQGCPMADCRLHYSPARPAGARHHHSDGAPGWPADRLGQDVQRPRVCRASGVRREPVPAAAAGDVSGCRGDSCHLVRDDRGHSGLEPAIPPGPVRDPDQEGRRRNKAEGVLRRVPAMGAVSPGRHRPWRVGVDESPGREHDQTRSHRALPGKKGTNRPRSQEADDPAGPDRRHAAIRPGSQERPTRFASTSSWSSTSTRIPFSRRSTSNAASRRKRSHSSGPTLPPSWREASRHTTRSWRCTPSSPFLRLVSCSR